MTCWNGLAAVVWALWTQCSHTLVGKVGTQMTLCPCQHLKCQPVQMLPLVRFQSQQCIIIHHTHNDLLEWSGCSGLGVMDSVLTYFGGKSGDTNDTLSLPTPQMSAGADASTC